MGSAGEGPFVVAGYDGETLVRIYSEHDTWDAAFRALNLLDPVLLGVDLAVRPATEVLPSRHDLPSSSHEAIK